MIKDIMGALEEQKSTHYLEKWIRTFQVGFIALLQ